MQANKTNHTLYKSPSSMRNVHFGIKFSMLHPVLLILVLRRN